MDMRTKKAQNSLHSHRNDTTFLVGSTLTRLKYTCAQLWAQTALNCVCCFLISVGSHYFCRICFSRLFRCHNSCRCFCVELVKLLPVHRYSVDFFFIFWSLLGSDRKQNTAKAGARGVRIVALSISSHELNQ